MTLTMEMRYWKRDLVDDMAGTYTCPHCSWLANIVVMFGEQWLERWLFAREVFCLSLAAGRVECRQQPTSSPPNSGRVFVNVMYLHSSRWKRQSIHVISIHTRLSRIVSLASCISCPVCHFLYLCTLYAVFLNSRFPVNKGASGRILPSRPHTFSCGCNFAVNDVKKNDSLGCNLPYGRYFGAMPGPTLVPTWYQPGPTNVDPNK